MCAIRGEKIIPEYKPISERPTTKKTDRKPTIEKIRGDIEKKQPEQQIEGIPGMTKEKLEGLPKTLQILRGNLQRIAGALGKRGRFGVEIKFSEEGIKLLNRYAHRLNSENRKLGLAMTEEFLDVYGEFKDLEDCKEFFGNLKEFTEVLKTGKKIEKEMIEGEKDEEKEDFEESVLKLLEELREEGYSDKSIKSLKISLMRLTPEELERFKESMEELKKELGE
ncbi:MAG: hypothetical protein IB617_02020 [Candidatus Nealsonbacteria bacterium]|nr:MAG: hypothetical protein IB617_02020 [Candidatus Nealsonbacteria bacterium]